LRADHGRSTVERPRATDPEEQPMIAHARTVAALAAGIVLVAAIIFAVTRAFTGSAAPAAAGPERPNLLASAPHRRTSARGGRTPSWHASAT
jgi:hypothetical protein